MRKTSLREGEQLAQGHTAWVTGSEFERRYSCSRVKAPVVREVPFLSTLTYLNLYFSTLSRFSEKVETGQKEI